MCTSVISTRSGCTDSVSAEKPTWCAWTDGWVARSLSNKYRRAVFHEQTTREYMEQLEEEVKDDPVLGVAALDRWKEEEKEWLEKVVKLEEHKDLENIYELKEKHRECSCVTGNNRKLTRCYRSFARGNAQDTH